MRRRHALGILVAAERTVDVGQCTDALENTAVPEQFAVLGNREAVRVHAPFVKVAQEDEAAIGVPSRVLIRPLSAIEGTVAAEPMPAASVRIATTIGARQTVSAGHYAGIASPHIASTSISSSEF
jgi:hypothetical protein